MTIVGIILSVALLTAVTEGAYSGVQFLRRSVEQRVGSFFGYFDNLTEGEASQLTQSHEVTKSTTWQDIGWAAIGSSNDYKPYLHVVSVDADFRSLVAVNLTSGRMPEKAGEILLPDHLLTNGDRVPSPSERRSRLMWGGACMTATRWMRTSALPRARRWRIPGRAPIRSSVPTRALTI